MILQAPERSFLDVDVELDPARVRTPYAFLGIPFGPPYSPADLHVCAGAADAVRAVAHRMGYRALATHHDFDLDGPLFPGDRPTVTDCGNVVGDIRDPDAIWDRGTGVGWPEPGRRIRRVRAHRYSRPHHRGAIGE